MVAEHHNLREIVKHQEVIGTIPHEARRASMVALVPFTYGLYHSEVYVLPLISAKQCS